MINIDMDEVKSESERPLSSNEIHKMLDSKTRILTYKQLMKRNNINEVLEPFESCVILYEWKHNYGHWVCLIKRGNVVEWFDSFGLKPDDERKFVPPNYIHNYPYKHLTKLLLDSGYEIRYNHFKLQNESPNIATCGRWVVARILLKDLSENEFNKLFSGKDINKDYLVTIFTMAL